MPANETDHDWEAFANQDPYWAVLTQDRFRKKVMDEAGRREFFLSGEKYIEWVFAMIRNHIDPQFNPATGLDFGCGVGRLVLPIGRRCQRAVGADVSEAMLAEARKNCQTEKVENVSVVKGDDNCSNLGSGFDFINSFIVFQHIPCDRGISLFRRLAELLNAGGVGAVHLTYSRSNFPVKGGIAEYNPAKKEVSQGGRHHLKAIQRAVRDRVAGIFRRPASLAGGAAEAPKSTAPVMQMNTYLLNPLFQILQEAGVREMHLSLSDHADAFGAVLFFKKGPRPYAFPALNE